MADYASSLIQSLRGGSGDFGTNNPGVSFLANPTMASAPINFRRAPRTGMTNRPEVLQMPAYVPQPSGGGMDDIPSPVVPDRGFNFDLPLMDEPYVEPDPVEPDPVEEPVAESFPVPDPGPIYTEELPPLEPVAESFPVPDQPPPDYVDLPPLPDEQPAPAPPPEYDEIPEGEIEIAPMGGSQPARDAIEKIGDITEVGSPLEEWDRIELPIPDIAPPPIPVPEPAPEPAPEYDEIPEGEIEVVPPGSSQPARDALDGIGDITEVGDPLDEWDPIELPIPEIPLPDIPQPEPEVPSGDIGGGAGDFYVPPQRIDSVSPDPLDEWDWIELEEPEIPLPEIPAAAASYGFSDAELDMLLNDYSLMGL